MSSILPVSTGPIAYKASYEKLVELHKQVKAELEEKIEELEETIKEKDERIAALEKDVEASSEENVVTAALESKTDFEIEIDGRGYSVNCDQVSHNGRAFHSGWKVQLSNDSAFKALFDEPRGTIQDQAKEIELLNEQSEQKDNRIQALEEEVEMMKDAALEPPK